MSCFSRSRPGLHRAASSNAESTTTFVSVFTDPEADTLILSSDEVRFRVHKHILSHASPIFEGMFAVPTPPSADGASEDDLPVVPVTESSLIMEQLLRFCYPSLNGMVEDLKTLRQLFAAAEKYDMKGVIAQLGFVLRYQFIDKEPQSAFALACIYGLPEEAKLAAKQTLLYPHPGPMLPEYDEMPASTYYKLVVYRHKCMDVIQPFITDWAYRVCGLRDIGWTKCPSCTKSGSTSVDGPSYWFADHLERTKAAYLARPRGSTVASTRLSQETINKHFPMVPDFGSSPAVANAQCTCRAQAPMRLVDFNEKLGVLLEKKISEIPFPLK